jgi:hypothetical protein
MARIEVNEDENVINAAVVQREPCVAADLSQNVALAV